ncbi:MAG TPA: aminodeoxychorismate lyase, partial [Methylococcaceae bacterium]|nr:aminodeoxychorismate lyase [Methylococcaceae bacterium]
MQISKTASYALIAFSYFGGWAWMNYDAVLHKVAITQETLTIDIEKGDSFAKLTDRLVAQQVDINPFWFKVLGLTSGAKKKIKKGEYELTKGLTAPEMIALFVQG